MAPAQTAVLSIVLNAVRAMGFGVWVAWMGSMWLVAASAASAHLLFTS